MPLLRSSRWISSLQLGVPVFLTCCVAHRLLNFTRTRQSAGLPVGPAPATRVVTDGLEFHPTTVAPLVSLSPCLLVSLSPFTALTASLRTTPLSPRPDTSPTTPSPPVRPTTPAGRACSDDVSTGRPVAGTGHNRRQPASAGCDRK